MNKPSLFTAGSGRSMMRWALYAIVLLVIIIGVVSIAVQVMLALKWGEVDWTGYSLFITSLAGLAGVGITGKVLQKKEEVKYENSKNE